MVLSQELNTVVSLEIGMHDAGTDVWLIYREKSMSQLRRVDNPHMKGILASTSRSFRDFGLVAL